ncbi:MAG: DUF167 domain-containing protein [Candidatus Yonathbacteria bacterium]|nr:DUF167 domain-containing protein [Candidatus Yonathbacteria bacterium]
MYIKVRVTPDAKRETLEQDSGDHFTLSVKEPAEQNRANKRVIALMAQYFNVSIGKVRIISGHHSGGKILSVDVE